MRLYFDACCLNRLTDDQGQSRIRNEAEAIERLMGFATRSPNVWTGSAVLEAEIARNPNLRRREDARLLLTFVEASVSMDEAIVQHGLDLERIGFPAFDAMHLACAHRGGVDIFLTTDDRPYTARHSPCEQVNVSGAKPGILSKGARECGYKR